VTGGEDTSLATRSGDGLAAGDDGDGIGDGDRLATAADDGATRRGSAARRRKGDGSGSDGHRDASDVSASLSPQPRYRSRRDASDAVADRLDSKISRLMQSLGVDPASVVDPEAEAIAEATQSSADLLSHIQHGLHNPDPTFREQARKTVSHA
jgi:hypothetical protein